jgi:hypothetical protein
VDESKSGYTNEEYNKLFLQKWISPTHLEIGNLWAQHQEVYAFAMALNKLLMEKNA